MWCIKRADGRYIVAGLVWSLYGELALTFNYYPDAVAYVHRHGLTGIGQVIRR